MRQIEYEQLEEVRRLMQEIASDKDLTDYRVVSISEKLDLLINDFYKRKLYFNLSLSS